MWMELDVMHVMQRFEHSCFMSTDCGVDGELTHAYVGEFIRAPAV